MGTPEILVKRGCPCSSRFTPVGAPIGRSGALSSVGASVFSAQFFSAAEGSRLSNTSAMGLSATCGLDGWDGFFSMRTQSSLLRCNFDHREVCVPEQHEKAGQNDRSVRDHPP